MPLDPNAVPGLLRALDSDDVYVRITAAEALGKIGNPVAVERLFATLDHDRPDVRRRVVRALERIGTEPKARAGAQVVPGLARALRDPEVTVRWAAESALQRLAISSARQALAEWHQDRESG
ncbi:MAG TPA: HEAT repeat domain-containing protein [Aggregatilineaceae bacterium]|nr:HEAT repeat domain-containing protein [Aggregatilineaceae bacterium]